MKLTHWFDADVKPVRVGLYQRNYGSDGDLNIGNCFWNGKWWSWSDQSARGFPAWKTTKSASQDKPWRGLASKP